MCVCVCVFVYVWGSRLRAAVCGRKTVPQQWQLVEVVMVMVMVMVMVVVVVVLGWGGVVGLGGGVVGSSVRPARVASRRVVAS